MCVCKYKYMNIYVCINLYIYYIYIYIYIYICIYIYIYIPMNTFKSIGKNASVDFQGIYRDLLDGERRESSEDLNISPPEICTSSSQMRNDSIFMLQ